MQQASADNQSALKWHEALENEISGLTFNPTLRVFAVFDGAILDNPAYQFGKRQLFARPLFGGNAPQDFVNSGPWLIDLYHAPPRDSDKPTSPEPCDPAIQVRSLIKLAADKPALVFWIGGPDLTADHLYRHLRSLNKVLIPKEDGEPAEQEAVIFRHADGNVLASVLPVLDERQFARLFGPALALTFHAPDFPDEDGSPIRRALLPRPAACPPPGMLALTPEQMRGVKAARMSRSQRRIVKYLRKVAPKQTRSMADWDLEDQTAHWMNEARSLGVRSEAGTGRWCYLQVITAGEIGRQKSVTDFVTRKNPGNTPGASTDERVEVLMWMAGAQARRMGQ